MFRGADAEQVQRCRCAEVQSICKGSGEVSVQAIVQRRCSDRHADVQVIVQAQWWFSRGAEVTRGGAKQVQR